MTNLKSRIPRKVVCKLSNINVDYVQQQSQISNTPEELESLKKTLVTSSVKLLKDYNIQQSNIFSWIRNGLQEHVDSYPKQYVLYNTVYGGYGLHDTFMQYCRDNGDTIYYEYDRKSGVKHIVPFAKHILSNPKHDGLFNILYIYEHYDFEFIISMMNKYKQMFLTLQRIKPPHKRRTLVQRCTRHTLALCFRKCLPRCIMTTLNSLNHAVMKLAMAGMSQVPRHSSQLSQRCTTQHSKTSF